MSDRVLVETSHFCELSLPRFLTPKGRIYMPRSIHQYSIMAPRLSGQNSIFGGVFFVSKSLLGIKEQKELKKKLIL